MSAELKKAVSYLLHDHDRELPVELEAILRDSSALEKLELSQEELRDALSGRVAVEGLIARCSWCGRVRDRDGCWHRIVPPPEWRDPGCFSHGLCEPCAREFLGEGRMS